MATSEQLEEQLAAAKREIARLQEVIRVLKRAGRRGGSGGSGGSEKPAFDGQHRGY